jgi:peptidoglycan-associated lipoprotein
MFMFKKITTTIIVAFATAGSLAAIAANYPITPNEAADLHNLGAGVNSPESEYTPYITPDEKFLFFQSNRDPAAGPEGDYDLWYSMNKNAEKGGDPLFEVSGNVGLPVNSENLDGHPSLRRLPTGEFEMFFSSFASPTRPGPALTNIYHTVWKAGKWTTPEPVTEVNSEFHDRMPSISQDGRYLFFSSDRLGGKGGDDIWFVERDETTGKWGGPQNAGSVNTPASEVTPSIHSDGITLYFSSDRSGGVGGYDIYFTQSVAKLANPDAGHIADKGWAKPLNLGKPFNSEFDDEYPTVIANGERVYFTSNRSEGLGAFDIYRARVPLFARPTIRLSLAGKTLIAGTKRAVNARVSLVSGEISQQSETSAEQGGSFRLQLINQKEYRLQAEAAGFRRIDEEFDTRKIYDKPEIEKNLQFVRDVKVPKVVNLLVSFETADGKNITPKAQQKLSPKEKKFTKFTTGKKQVLVRLDDFAGSEEKALAVLEGYVIEVQADKKGLEPLKEKRSISEVLDQYKDAIPETIAVRFVMVSKGQKAEKPVKVVTKEEEPADEEEPEEAKAQGKETRLGGGTFTFLGRVYFASGVHDTAVGNAKAAARRAAAEYKKAGRGRIFVYGHGDSQGDTATNKQLSRKRAAYVKKLLISEGVPARSISTQGAGESQRIYKNDDTEKKRQKNRRAEIYISIPREKSE